MLGCPLSGKKTQSKFLIEKFPNLKIYRPYDLNELIGSYIEIFKNK